MPDYLSPGVYIEELPPQLRAIEGVSTSTAGFAGVTERGTVPGFPLPFTPAASDPQVVTLIPTPTPVLVTSFADFTRQFGDPLPLPDPFDNNYLGYAVRGFFNNGGQIAYIARVVHHDPADLPNSASYSALRLCQGTVLRLAADAKADDTTLSLSSLRGLAVSTTPSALTFFHKNGTAVQTPATPATPAVAATATTPAVPARAAVPAAPLAATVASYNSHAGTVTLSARIGVALSASDVYIVVNGQQPATAGPRFWARNPGSWSAELSVSVTPTRRRAVAITAAANPTATEIQVASTAGFYTGAIVEVDNGSQQTYVVVAGVRAGGLLELTAALNMTVAPSASSNARIVEIDISIVDPSPAVPVAETFTQLSWNPDPSVRASHYATVINAQSQLVYVQPPGVGGLDGSEAATLPSQPTTFNGWPFSAASNAAALATTPAVPELNTLLQAAQALGPTVTAMPAGALPLLPADPLVIAVNGAATTLTGTLAAVTALGTGGSTALTTALSALTTAATAIVTAANGAVAQATTAPQTPATAAALATDVTTVTTDIAALPAAITAATTAVAGARSRAGAGAVTIGDDGSPPTAPDYVGLDNGPGLRSGIQALKDAESISIIAAPGRVEPEVQGELINQCELLRYRFAVLDGQQNPVGGSVNAIVAHRDQYDSSYAAYYVPWLQIALGNQSVFLPPSGHVAGIYAGTDNSRGVWKAPANVVVQNITGLKTYIVKGEQDILNPVGVNCIRRFDMLGTRVWGARTISSDDSLKYVNVRRTLIFLEASIDQGTQWVVFEPNNPDTWARVTDSVTAFLMTQWINGALFGVKPTDSFFVRCDLTTMTADDIQNGRLICLIGVAIVRPAEFVIFRIEQITGLPTQ